MITTALRSDRHFAHDLKSGDESDDRELQLSLLEIFGEDLFPAGKFHEAICISARKQYATALRRLDQNDSQHWATSVLVLC